MPTERSLPTENDCQESIDWNARCFFFLDKKYQTCSHMEGKNSSHSLPIPFFHTSVLECWRKFLIYGDIINGLFQVEIVE